MNVMDKDVPVTMTLRVTYQGLLGVKDFCGGLEKRTGCRNVLRYLKQRTTAFVLALGIVAMCVFQAVDTSVRKEVNDFRKPMNLKFRIPTRDDLLLFVENTVCVVGDILHDILNQSEYRIKKELT